MKIKEVCKQTGLTDRAIRFYIENELLFPTYTENYAGRKTYDFSNDDVMRLNQISTLRKYDFSVESIKELLLPEGDVQKILEEHIENLKEKSKSDIEKLEGLVSSLHNSPWTPEELCSSLNSSNVKPRTVEENNIDNEQIIKKKKRDFILSSISAVSMLFILAISIPIAQKGFLNNVLINFFFAAEALLGFYIVKNFFAYLKPKNRFVPYVLIILIIYLIGTFSKYI